MYYAKHGGKWRPRIDVLNVRKREQNRVVGGCVGDAAANGTLSDAVKRRPRRADSEMIYDSDGNETCDAKDGGHQTRGTSIQW